ncbi:hypothetical protein AB0K51_16480 [Kitasatospora sp. NPDC049285]|uniref:hypothetical protein n=1 Tax=Kitasatospora sp. NPDC049285 TaxID=3157096 RepID=UPI00344A3DBA
MALNIRFVTIAALGALLVAGTGTAAELVGADRPAAVVTADGTAVDGPAKPDAAALPQDAQAQSVVVGPSAPPSSPAPSGSASGSPIHNDTWGWG